MRIKAECQEAGLEGFDSRSCSGLGLTGWQMLGPDRACQRGRNEVKKLGSTVRTNNSNQVRSAASSTSSSDASCGGLQFEDGAR